MLEWLAVSTGVELGRLVLKQVLNLGKSALEDYVKDFFKNCLSSSITQLNSAFLKKPMAEAIGFFIRRFVKELQFNDVPETSIEHHYNGTIKRFVQNKAVRPILGKAFEKGCKQIDYQQLEDIWIQQYQKTGWQFPLEDFDWRGVAKEYVVEVKGIIKANAELRSLLEAELLEEIAQNTSQISPGFDIAKYRESLQCSYGYLKLYSLDSTDRVDAVKLWSMFIEQTVREALPPIRYDLPLDLKRQLQEEGRLEDDLSPEALENYRRDYWQQPARKVLGALADSDRGVILGDPGAGKSTLLQYLALDWVEGKTETLPLLIELREYALAPVNSFLEFLHCGRGADWQFDQKQLHEHLLEEATLVMFDGLDEVFARSSQAAIIDEIIRFSQQYPQAKVLVTSRIIGYNPERFQHAGFRQFTIQPLDKSEIQDFIERWYDLAMGADGDKERLKQRLKDAIANSPAIKNLADNPLLLTMMAILNRRQELPRDRADLYDQASRVLLYHWDVDHKRLQLPLDTIGRREKQEILRLIAYQMQAGEEGLKGNLISAEQLTGILTSYLREQGFSEPREKASLLIKQLRERNFILCYRGADTYGFVHRTFLEYFCAVGIVNRFEKQQVLSFEELRDEVFGQHWQDETWHEVLRLICGLIDTPFADKLICFLASQNNFRKSREFEHIFMATECLLEVKNKSTINSTFKKILVQLKMLTEYGDNSQISNMFGDFTGWTYDSFHNIYVLEPWDIIVIVRLYAFELAEKIWCNSEEKLNWLKECARSKTNWVVAVSAIKKLTKNYKDVPGVFDLVTKFAQLDTSTSFSNVQEVALEELAFSWGEDPKTLKVLKRCAVRNRNFRGRWKALRALRKICKEQKDLFDFLCDCAIQDPFEVMHWSNRNPRQAALETLIECYYDRPLILSFLMERAEVDADGRVRSFLLSKLADHWKDDPHVFSFLCLRALEDPHISEKIKRPNPREASLKALFKNYPNHPKTIELLSDRATNDPDEQLRNWAQQQLQQQT